MTTGYEVLSYWDLALAAAIFMINAALSLWLKLGIERSLLIAAGRMILQLLLVGLVLKALFATTSLWLTLLVALIMTAFAAREITARQDRRFKGWWAYSLGGTTMMLAGFLLTIIALTTQISPDPWYDPRYAIPLLGMILGNTMTGIALGLDTLTGSVARERPAIEAQLTLGETAFAALRPFSRQALRSGFMPIVNAMAATGLVSLPGMMTGQILAGVEPTQAVKYQLLIMFVIGSATGLGVLLAVLGAVWRLTDERHRLRLDRLADKAS